MVGLLKDRDEYIRAWAIQFLTEDSTISSEALKALEALSREERSPVVRLYLSAALQRIPDQERWTIAEGLLRHEEDIDDPNIPYMIWFGIESIISQDPERALDLAQDSRIPVISNHIARRLVDGDQLDPLVHRLSKRSERTSDLLKGMLAGLEGRTDVEPPSIWESVYPTLLKKNQFTNLAQEIAQKFGSREAALSLLAKVNESNESHSRLNHHVLHVLRLR